MEKETNVIIIEDEVPASRMLEQLILQIRPKWKIKAIFDSVESATEWLNKNEQPNLIFMDIQLSDGVCFEIFNQVELNSMIIFTTAYDEYAVRAFKVNSIDYLLKPVKKDELEDAIKKYEVFHRINEDENYKKDIDYSDIAQAVVNAKPQYRSRFLISASEGYYTLITDEIAFFYSQNKITFAVDFKGKEHVLDFTLEKLEEQLNPEVFFRANRQTIINIDAIHKIETYFHGKLIVKTTPPHKEKISVSKEKAVTFKRWLDR